MAASFTDSFNVAQAAAMCLAEARRSSQIRLPLVPSHCGSGGPSGAPPAWRALPWEPNQVNDRGNGAARTGKTRLPLAWDTPPEQPALPLGGIGGLAGSSPARSVQPEEPAEALGESGSRSGRMPAWHAQAEEPGQALSSAPAAEGRRRARSRATREAIVHHAALQGSGSPGGGASAGVRVALRGALSQDEQRVLVALMMLRSVY